MISQAACIHELGYMFFVSFLIYSFFFINKGTINQKQQKLIQINGWKGSTKAKGCPNSQLLFQTGKKTNPVNITSIKFKNLLHSLMCKHADLL